ncbi:hypothetical protein JTB14_022871 [Gonioctena quinquepunctata]|nr:hypothetical protein JTB14_022871 [Gonioctena quinquepunctata]
MPKRNCPFGEAEPYIKKQTVNETKPRGIRSMASEKALQLLYKGASKQFQSPLETRPVTATYYNCSQCSAPISVKSKCFYCDNFICSSCNNLCTNCEEDFCKNCSFPNYSEGSAVCYSCY